MSKREDIFVVITERDIGFGEAFKNGGAIVQETYTRDAYLYKALERAKAIRGKYGEAWIGRVSVLTIEEADELAETKTVA